MPLRVDVNYDACVAPGYGCRCATRSAGPLAICSGTRGFFFLLVVISWLHAQTCRHAQTAPGFDETHVRQVLRVNSEKLQKETIFADTIKWHFLLYYRRYIVGPQPDPENESD